MTDPILTNKIFSVRSLEKYRDRENMLLTMANELQSNKRIVLKNYKFSLHHIRVKETQVQTHIGLDLVILTYVNNDKT